MPRLLRAVVSLTCLVLVSGLGLGATTLPASASSTRLCTGYDGCARAGMPHAGYKQAGGAMYWNMYAGHNCTNYVAYRMVRSGLPNIRPWIGSGNAAYWGTFNARLTNTTPKVGAVAWWKANVPGAGSSGHVAYVEQVVSPDEIIVSEDNWKGEFYWTRITRSGTGWPSGFVHFNDVPLRNTAAPTVSGEPGVGGVLTASPGTWRPATATYRYQWRADGVAIAGATGPTLTLGLADVGKKVSVRVVASKLGYPRTAAVSAQTSPVEPVELVSTGTPTVTGDEVVGSTLTASAGAWAPTPTALAYQWLADGEPVGGATTPTLTLGPEMLGKAVSVRVTASRNGYDDASSVSTPTGPVAPGTLALADRPTVTGIPRPGETLQLDVGAAIPDDAAVSVQWLRAGVPVDGATGSTYPLTTGDLGSRITARVGLTKPGFTTLRTRAVATRRVRSVPTLRARTEAGTGRLGVTVTVSAAGVRPVTGTVRIRSGGSLLREVTLRDGAAQATLRGLPRGLRSFVLRYTGSEKVSAAALTRAVRIG